MQFLWKYIDEFVGKGLEWSIILEMLVYASANLVPMALPLAILLSSIMTFGAMGEHYELVAIKSSGISLQRTMMPVLFITGLLALGAFYFQNNVSTVANLKMASLLYDIRHTKPAINIKPNVFYKELDGYVILIGKKDDDNQTIHNVTIYDHTQHKGNNRVLKAKSGKMYSSEDENYLIFQLQNGVSYQEDKEKNVPQLYRTKFDEQILRFDLSGFKIQRTDDDLFKDHYQMLKMSQIENELDTLKHKRNLRKERFNTMINSKITFIRDTIELPVLAFQNDSNRVINHLSKKNKLLAIDAALSISRSNKTYINSIISEFESLDRQINRYSIEWHRKLTLSFACIILFFIGAPLGAIIRKGGLGTPVVISVLFFLVFHILSITGEKLIKNGGLIPFEGMWMASLILTPIGAFLTYKATTDSVIMDPEFYGKIFNGIWRIISFPFRKLNQKKGNEVTGN